VPEVLERLDAFFAAHPYSHEIIFVNDGSPDESWKVLGGLAGRGRGAATARWNRIGETTRLISHCPAAGPR
jgi:hypothetical protein